MRNLPAAYKFGQRLELCLHQHLCRPFCHPRAHARACSAALRATRPPPGHAKCACTPSNDRAFTHSRFFWSYLPPPCARACRACNDALRATQLLPDYAKCWLRAGDALAELRRFNEAADYYEVCCTISAYVLY
jgi:hypothetical protein